MTWITQAGRGRSDTPDVMPLTPPRRPAARISLLGALLLAGGLAGCAAPALPPDGVVLHESLPEDWTPPRTPEAPAAPAPGANAGGDWRQQTTRAAGAVGRGVRTGAVVVGRGVRTGASAVGRGTATAFRGVTRGFQEPEPDARYGPYPEAYVELVQKYFLHVLRIPRAARFKMDLPTRGYMNRGLLLGGGVAWQGWVVDVQVQRDGGWGRDEPTTRHFAVRIRDDFVIDVHRGDDALVRRVEGVPAQAQR